MFNVTEAYLLTIDNCGCCKALKATSKYVHLFEERNVDVFPEYAKESGAFIFPSVYIKQKGVNANAKILFSNVTDEELKKICKTYKIC